VKFADFDGVELGNAIIALLKNPPAGLAAAAKRASERVRAELDWSAISRRAIDFSSAIASKKQRP
jgi:glycosyltransferase involved in cell wall biosynthesis